MMCDICQEVIDLIGKYDARDERLDAKTKARPMLVNKSELNVIISYTNMWMQRHCICCWKDQLNFGRFNSFVKAILNTVLHFLRITAYQLRLKSGDSQCDDDQPKDGNPTECNKPGQEAPTTASPANKSRPVKMRTPANDDFFDDWNLEDRERLLHLASKAFHITFPLYVAHKHTTPYRLEDLSPKETSSLSTYCEMAEVELPIYMMRNLAFFCENNGIDLFVDCFSVATPDQLPLPLAHAMIAVLSNIKPWMNNSLVLSKLVALRTNVIDYLCKVPDKDLRVMSNRTMFEFIWQVVKEHLDLRSGSADKEGLQLALKYFTSSTLTMRLTGITQINQYITIYTELCQTEANNQLRADSRAEELANWIIDNKIIEHVFGPNSHVEVIKQSNIILTFVVTRVTVQHIDVIWSAFQMKHCGRQVLDVLLPLIKNLNFKPVLHIYWLLKNLDPKDHTEQTLILASQCLKFIWGQTNISADMIINNQQISSVKMLEDLTLVRSPIFTMLPSSGQKRHEGDTSSTSGSVDGSDEDEDDEEYAVDVTEEPIGADERFKQAIRSINPNAGSGGSSSDGTSDSDDEDVEQNIKEKLKLHQALVGEYSSSNDDLVASAVSDVVNAIHNENCVVNRNSAESRNDSESPMKYDSKENADGKFSQNFSEMDFTFPHSMEMRKGISDDELKDFFETKFEKKTEEGDDNEDNMSKASSSKLSDKNMADFEGEDSGSDELVQINDQKGKKEGSSAAQKLANFAQQIVNQQNMPEKSTGNENVKTSDEDQVDGSKIDEIDLAEISIDNVCKPGRTLLWDLLQDDMIHQLTEGLAQEAEKIFWNTVCWSSDRRIRMKFIEGCLDNLAKNYSVITSLRLLPKFLMSFQQFRGGGMDTHQILLWADKEKNMLKHFFTNLVLYTNNRQKNCKELKCGSSNDIYTHTEQIQARLHFLSFVFSCSGSPNSFRLSQEQVDILWSTLAYDHDSADEIFNWLLSQVRNRDQHGLSSDTLHHILVQRVPLLSAENFTMMALDLLQTLSGCLIATQQMSKIKDVDSVAIKQLWDIALRSCNIDVSMAAIKHLNSYYIHFQPHLSKLEKEEVFIKQCMDYIETASKEINDNEEKNLTIIQRALVLLKTHLEVFRCRYAYNFRRWQLEGDSSIASHRCRERTGNLVRISCQLAALTDKVTFEMQSTDYVGEFRAEVQHWWEGLTRKYGEVGEDKRQCNFNTGMMNDGPLRLLTQGQEITHDLDEKQLCEVGFKDMHLVYVSVGMARFGKFRDQVEPASTLPPPPKERLPSMLLLQPKYFEQLFLLMQQLESLKTSAHTKAQVLSRRVWEIIQILPTSQTLLECFQSIADGDHEDDQTSSATPSTSQTVPQIKELFNSLLSPSSPQKLMYSCQIVESLRKSSKIWAQKFVEKGGLQHLFDIFVSGVLHAADGSSWSEWKQDCLASLLQLIYQFGVNPLPAKTCSNEAKNEEEKASGSGNMPGMNVGNSQTQTSLIISEMIKKTKRTRKGSTEKLLVPQLNTKLLNMIKDVDSMLRVLLTILNEATSKTNEISPTYQTGFWGRAQVVHHTLTFLISWAFSFPQILNTLYQSQNLDQLLKKLVLDDPDPAIRREACTGFYRLCLGFTADGKTGHIFIPQLLNSLISFLKVAQSMRPPKTNEGDDILAIPEKEPYGPGCKDYFWLICRLVDSLDSQQLTDNIAEVDLDGLCAYVAKAIVLREVRELRHNSPEDEGLRGLISLMTVTIKHNPQFKFSKEGSKFVQDIFDCLFAIDTQNQKHMPKCKTPSTRSAAFDLLVELVKNSEENYIVMVNLLLDQHNPELSGRMAPYPWDYWPHDDCRSECGYVGLTNLGATCYMASCMQHLYMLPEARYAILSANPHNTVKHEAILRELQKMFIYLLESERKSYNPKSFCKVYTMDHQPLNTSEQKDMTEFFTDLISKLEEMTIELKEMVKRLFSGKLSNNVVSLDCPHISRTTEEFYTLRCQVADMRNLYESLDEITVKDTLEGDNMYTCARCGRKVRAEKRACIKKLPKILCFNTMRYTFNMVTMTKEKVNTHFSFPLRLDMAPYLEKNLIPDKEVQDSMKQMDDKEQNESTEYELIGVTVHTGTADGGHYYAFIREREAPGIAKDKWYLFNDAEVKPFDHNQLAAECFGGEMTSKTYDSVTDKFMDFSFEKTNSAYMLFYERIEKSDNKSIEIDIPEKMVHRIGHSPELAEWIWADNTSFLRDKSIFEHTYFDFMWQVCGYIPQTLPPNSSKITLLSAQLATSFVLETLIHAKEKPTIANWIELLTKQFNSSQAACEWLMDHLSNNDWWPIQILLRCPNQMVRQLFQRLCIHVITQLKPTQSAFYLQPLSDDSDDSNEAEVISHVGKFSCVTRFIRKLLDLISVENSSAKPHLKHLTEYFAFLYEFAKQGEEECKFLLAVEAISTIVHFYMSHCGKSAADYVEVMSEDDDEDEEDGYMDGNAASAGYSGAMQRPIGPTIGPINEDKFPKPASLDKMITLVALLVEKSRGKDNRLRLSDRDYDAITGGKPFPFIQQQIRDNINLRQTCSLICSLCRFNEHFATLIVNMIFISINKSPETSGPFFKLLTMLVEIGGNLVTSPSTLLNSISISNSFSNLILPRILDIAEQTPLQTLDWLTTQASRNKFASLWILQMLETGAWMQFYLMQHKEGRVRNCAAQLLISLVPNSNFRQSFRPSRPCPFVTIKECDFNNSENLQIREIEKILRYLLSMLKVAKQFVDPSVHGTQKLTAYFSVMTYCLISHYHKMLLVPYFNDLWAIFQPRLSEPPISINHNKQALLAFWFHACNDCPENVKCIVQNPQVTKNIAFNYILADHDDQDVVFFNKQMLPNYYGLLRLCCQQSRQFTRHLALHQNIQWAFKNITPYADRYQAAVQELFKLMKLFVQIDPEATENEINEIVTFKRTTLQMYLSSLELRTSWQTMIFALQTLVENQDDRLFLLSINGLANLFQLFSAMYVMFHEATACNITNEIVDVLKMIVNVLKTASAHQEQLKMQDNCNWRDHQETIRKIMLLINSYTPVLVRQSCFEVLFEMTKLNPNVCLHSIGQHLAVAHVTHQESSQNFIAGPYFPRRGQRVILTKSSIRPTRPVFQMCFHPKMLDVQRGVDKEYDTAITDYFAPYYQFIDSVTRIAVKSKLVSSEFIGLTTVIAQEALHLRLSFFPKLWLDLLQAAETDESAAQFIQLLINTQNFRDLVVVILTQERSFLNDNITYQMVKQILPKISKNILNQSFMTQIRSQIESFCQLFKNLDLATIESLKFGKQIWQLNADLRAFYLVFSNHNVSNISEEFVSILRKLKESCSNVNKKSDSGATPHKRLKKSDAEDDDEEQSDTVNKPTVEAESDSNSSHEIDPVDVNPFERLSNTVDELLVIVNPSV